MPKGVTRELGRARQPPCGKHPEEKGYRETKSPGIGGRFPPISEPDGTQTKEERKVLGEDSE